MRFLPLPAALLLSAAPAAAQHPAPPGYTGYARVQPAYAPPQWYPQPRPVVLPRPMPAPAYPYYPPAVRYASPVAVYRPVYAPAPAAVSACPGGVCGASRPRLFSGERVTGLFAFPVK